MAYITTRFDDRISFQATGGPVFDTNRVTVNSGRNFRNQNRLNATRMYDVSHAARLPAVWKPLIIFFHVAAGMFNTFRFKDWSDFEVLAGQGVFVMIDATHFQLMKRYSVGGVTHDRRITRPVVGTVVIVGGVVASTDHETGIVTMTSGTPTSYTCQFDVPCTFGVDKMDGTIIEKTPAGEFIYNWSRIPIIEDLE